MVAVLTASLLFSWGRIHDWQPKSRGGLFFGRLGGMAELFMMAHRHFFLSSAILKSKRTLFVRNYSVNLTRDLYDSTNPKADIGFRRLFFGKYHRHFALVFGKYHRLF